MATVNLGAIKFKWKGTYNASTAYTIDDVVSYNGSSYICIQASTGNLPTVTAYWEQMSQKGTDADLLNIASTAQGDIYYNNGSAIARLGAGTSGQYLETRGSGANPIWSTVSSGNYSVHAFDSYKMGSTVTVSSQSNYHDIAGGNTVTFTPTSTSDYILFFLQNGFYQGSANSGCDVYINYGTSSTLGSSNTKLDYQGQHNVYINASGFHGFISKTSILPCTSLTAGTQYYAEHAGASHSSNNTSFNYDQSQASGSFSRGSVGLIHFKYNG